VSFTIFSLPKKAAEMEMRAMLLMGLEHWLERSRMTQAEAAKVLGVTQARVSDLKRGKIGPIQHGLAGAVGSGAPDSSQSLNSPRKTGQWSCFW